MLTANAIRRQGLRCTPFQPTTNDKRCTNAHFSSTPLLLYSVCYRAFIFIKMAKEYIKIELTEDDIKKMVAEKYNLDINRTTINVSHYAGDAREPAYTSIVVTGQRDGGV